HLFSKCKNKSKMRKISSIIGLLCVAGCLANEALLPVLDSCLVCSSRTNLTCATDPEGATKFPCENGPARSGCYTRILEGFTYRGCAADLDEDVLNSCRNNENICTICVGQSNNIAQGCNNQVFPVHRHQCHQCRGEINGTCDGIPLGLPTVCEMFDSNDRCFILRTSTTITRGCLSNRGTNCEDPNHCHICEISGCNNLHGEAVPIAPGSAVTNTISMLLLSTSFIFFLVKSV
ncbi:hypothetical protein Bhyg_13448, partial [Pseudolycoriella hygida]